MKFFQKDFKDLIFQGFQGFHKKSAWSSRTLSGEGGFAFAGFPVFKFYEILEILEKLNPGI